MHKNDLRSGHRHPTCDPGVCELEEPTLSWFPKYLDSQKENQIRKSWRQHWWKKIRDLAKTVPYTTKQRVAANRSNLKGGAVRAGESDGDSADFE